MQSSDLFRQVRTYRELQDVNIQFLRGEIQKTPYHGGPVDSETIPLLSDLIRLNELGFVTVGGQPARDETKFVKRTWKVRGEEWGNWWVRTQQRPFLEGYLLKSQVYLFQEFMKLEPNYVYNIYEFVQEQTFWSWLTGSVREIRALILKTNHDNDVISVTRSRTHKTDPTVLESPDAGWETETIVPTKESVYDFDTCPNIQPILIPHTVKIVVIGQNYNKGSTEALMLRFFRFVELQRH